MNTKRLISLLVTLMLVISTFVTVSGAAFPDIESRHSWAEDAIDDMVSRGILKGYTDGTFKPDKSVTRLETLIIASRIMGVDEDENADYRDAAVKKYAGSLNAYNIDYKDEIAYLLYWDVLKTDELSSYISDSSKNQALKRYEAAVLLTKLVGGEDKALSESVIVIDFSDASSIPSSAKAYVKYINNIGLMNGMENNKFNPNGELTRAMISTIMYRAENFMEEKVVTGMVESVNINSITASINGSSQEIAVADDVTIKIDGNKSEISDLSVNQVIRIHYQGDKIRFIDAISDNLYYTVSGTISAISESSGTKKVTLKNSAGSQTYTIGSSCEYVVDEKISKYTDISNGSYATLTIQAGKVKRLAVETGSTTVKGTIDKVSINDDVIAVTVTDKNGEKKDYIMSQEIYIVRNSSKSDVHALAAGDSVTLTITDGEIEKLVATSTSTSVEGTISKIVISANSFVTIKTANTEADYTINSDTTFVVDGKEGCEIYDLRVGATADVRLDGTKIKSISTHSKVVSPTLTGVITYVHPTSYVMGLEVVNATTGETEVIQTVAKSTVKVTDTTSSRISSFKALEPGMTVVAVGESKYGVYEVSQIIVTATVD